MSRAYPEVLSLDKALFMGDGAMVVTCVIQYRRSGGLVSGVISSDPAVGVWAQDQDIPFHILVDSASDMENWAKSLDYDYFFSISNSSLIPESLLFRASKMAIHCFEDSPELNPHSRAILENHSHIRFQWREISRSSEPGAILGQKTIDVSDSDSAEILSLKALKSQRYAFKDVLDHIRDPESYTPPSHSEFNPTAEHPVEYPPFLWLDWKIPASRIASICRAVKTGPVANFIGLLKFELESNIFLLLDCEEESLMPQAPVGEIIAVDSEALVIGTGKGNLKISRVSDLMGKSVSLSDTFQCGSRLGHHQNKDFDDVQMFLASKWMSSVAGHEPGRVEELLQAHSFEIPAFWKINDQSVEVIEITGSDESFLFGEPMNLPIWSPSFDTQFESGAWLAGLLSNFLYRLTGQNQFSIPVSCRSNFPTDKAWSQLICPFIPVHWEADHSQPIQDGWWQHRASIMESAQLGPFFLDLFIRAPHLSSSGKSQFDKLLTLYVGNLADIDGLDAQPAIGIDIMTSGHFRLFVDKSLLSLSSAQAISRAFQHYFQSLSDNPGLELPYLNFGNPGSVRRIDPDFTFDLPASTSVIDFIESQAKRKLDACAVQMGDETLTYQELWNFSGIVAASLQKSGLDQNDPVGIFIERSFEYVIAFLGVLRAGGCVVPMRPSTPGDRLRTMVELTGMDSTISLESSTDTNSFKEFGPDFRDLPISIESFRSGDLQAHRSVPRPVAFDFASTAYIIFTSGSTGTPKPVQVGHRELLHHMLSFSKALGIDSTDRVLQFAGLGFDVSIEEIIPTLSMGAKLILPDPSEVNDLNGFWKMVKRNQISLANLPTAFWYSLVDETDGGEIPDCLSNLIIGGEKVSSSYLRRWFHFCRKPLVLWNGYGPTETTITATLLPIHKPSDSLWLEQNVPIGFGLGCCDIFTVDHFGKPLPSGIPGEILIAGQGVSRGYFNQPDHTRKVFVEAPMIGASVEHGRAYKSGDFGIISHDRSLHFLGRADSQVKVRGFRLELGEVEKAIDAHPGVEKAVVLSTTSDISGSNSLAAVIKWKRGSLFTFEELTSDLKLSLPAYMVPSVFDSVSQWPRTPNGKIDVHALRAGIDRARTRGKKHHSDTSSFSPIQKKIYTIWTEFLGSPPDGINDNFFHAGGDSLHAMRFLARLGKEFDRQVSLTDFYDRPSISALADWVSTSGSGTGKKTPEPSSSCTDQLPTMRLHLNDNPSSHPVFILPGGAGGEIEMFIYREVAEKLGSDFNTITFQPLQQGMESFPYDSVNTLALAVMREIKEIQPTGPYFFIGDCIGSVLTFEIAHLLEDEGHTVAHISLLDTQPHYHKQALKSQHKEKISQIVHQSKWMGRISRYGQYLSGLVSRPPHKWSAYLRELSQERQNHMALMEQGESPEDIPQSSLPEELGTTFFEMLCHHQPPKVKAPVDDYLPDSKMEMPDEHTWKNWTSGDYNRFFYREALQKDYVGRTFEYLKKRKLDAIDQLKSRLVKFGVLDRKPGCPNHRYGQWP